MPLEIPEGYHVVVLVRSASIYIDFLANENIRFHSIAKFVSKENLEHSPAIVQEALAFLNDIKKPIALVVCSNAASDSTWFRDFPFSIVYRASYAVMYPSLEVFKDRREGEKAEAAIARGERGILLPVDLNEVSDAVHIN